MRVISQNSYIDVPYEQIAISTGYNGTKTEHYIFANILHPGNINCKNILATYSTEEKALKAMEMLREEYLYSESGIGTDNWFAFIPPKIFKFPKDDEVEV